jgi:hypothetical protein
MWHLVHASSIQTNFIIINFEHSEKGKNNIQEVKSICSTEYCCIKDSICLPNIATLSKITKQHRKAYQVWVTPFPALCDYMHLCSELL